MTRILLKTYSMLGIIFLFVTGIIALYLLCTHGINLVQNTVSHEGWTALFNQTTHRLLPACAGTVILTVGSVTLAAPAGIITGIYISEYSNQKTRSFLIFLFRVMSGIPSIIYGLLGLVIILITNSLFSLTLRTSLIIAIISVSFLILPYIVHSTVMGLQSIPNNKRVTGLTLGCRKYQNIFRVLIPESSDALISGIILAIGRAAEDTAVIMLTGAAAFAGYPTSLSQPFEALPYMIYFQSAENQTPLSMVQIYTAAVLIILISGTLIHLSSYLQKRLKFKIRRV